MNIKDYRILHSQIIEEYQYIEYHLEGLIALIQANGEDFKAIAKSVGNDAMGELISKARKLVQENNYYDFLSKDDFKTLDTIKDDRNFYCHENFLANINDNYKIERSTSIEQDLTLVKTFNDKLTQAFKDISNIKDK